MIKFLRKYPEPVIVLLCLICLITGYLICALINGPKWSDTPKATWIPERRELQKIIGVEDDGIIGPKTIKAWDEYYIKQSAAAVMDEAYAQLDNGQIDK